MEGPIAAEPPPTPAEPAKPALDSRGARPVLALVVLGMVFSVGFTCANTTLETGGGKGPVTRISPMGASMENALPIILIVAGIALAVFYRERGAGFIALALGLPLFVAFAGGTLMTCSRGPALFDSMQDVETVEGGPNGQAAHLRSNGGGCYEVFVSEAGSMVMHRRGRFHSNRDSARIVWINGQITHDSVPLTNGNAYCKDWL